MNRIRNNLGTLLLVVLSAASVACSSVDGNSISEPQVANTPAFEAHGGHNDGHGGELTAPQRLGVALVRGATARFRTFSVAKGAGYTNQYPAGCAQSADGVQGYHYLNPALVDAKVELLRPELVMYEPQRDGSLELIGVDYVVPFTAWTSSKPPQLLGKSFMRNEPLGVWALHIWAWRHNPSGMFAMWNPRASCKYEL